MARKIETLINEMAVLSEILLINEQGNFAPSQSWIAEVLDCNVKNIAAADKRCKRKCAKYFDCNWVID